MIKDEFDYVCEIPSDINEHLPVLRDLASECLHITEMGVRGIVSTWAFMEGLKGRSGTLIGIDILPPNFYGGDLPQVYEYAKAEGVNFKFILGSTLDLTIDETDLIFVDTLHEYKQLKEELALHSDKARKYIVLHDTTSCREELWPAIRELLSKKVWQVKYEYPFNNGVTVFERC